MTDYEVNEILAKFEYNTDFWIDDGCVEFYYTHGGYEGRKPLYTESLDSLIDIWKITSYSMLLYHGALNGFRAETPFGEVCNDITDTIQQAAAHATAYSIIHLQE